MQGRAVERTWKTVATAVAVAATLMALYVQLFERRSREEEARLAAARLEDALAASRSRLKAEILAELRAELAREGSRGTSTGGQPIPGAVLRRPESDEDGGLGQVVDPRSGQLVGGVRSLSQRMEDADRALRRDLEEFRAATRQELEASRKATTLVLIALIPLVVHLLYSLWRDREKDL
jgi:hypothetical protein